MTFSAVSDVGRVLGIAGVTLLAVQVSGGVHAQSTLATGQTSVSAAQTIDIGPAPGRLIDIGGRKLHINCAGNGTPTVILEAGASSFAIDWSLVQPEVAKATRVCSYDRAGSGWSDPRPDVETPRRVIQDLHTGLQAAGEKPPYVMVGASMGGVYIRLYQLEYPAEVAGLVFVDPSTEDVLFAMYQGKGVAIASLTAAELLTTMPTTAVPVPRRSAQTGTPFDRLPRELFGIRVKLEQRLIDSVPPMVPADVVRESAEGQRAALARLQQSRTQADAPINAVPVVVLTRRDGPVAAHLSLAKLSKRSRHAVVPGAGHEIHLFAPATVVQAITEVTTPR
jgi:pimeloyl-ACP methyl ester carboxylesterase